MIEMFINSFMVTVEPLLVIFAGFCAIALFLLFIILIMRLGEWLMSL